MVAGPAAAQAVALAKRLPTLGVGLHLVLVEGQPMLPPETIPDLVDGTGALRQNMVALAFDIAMRPSVRRQMRAEITAQFEAFAQTGLTLDHVNGHKHFHVHPLIADMVLEIGARYRMRALRVPSEPAALVTQAEPQALAGQPAGSISIATLVTASAMAPWAALLRARARSAGLLVPDAVFGLRWSGQMTAERLLGILAHLPADGLVEIYTHPATCNDFAGHARGYGYVEELAALTDERVRDAVAHCGRRLGRFSDWSSRSD